MDIKEYVKTARKPRSHAHTDLVHAVLDYFGIYPDKIRAWQANTAALAVGKRFIRCGRKGQADVSGIWHNGIRVEVEMKIGKDKLRPEQIEFRDEILEMGGIYVECRSLDDIRFLVEG